MTNKNIYRSLGGLDPALIEKAAPKERVQKKNVILRWAALAACLALIITAVIGIPLLMDDGGVVNPPEYDPPDVSAVTSGNKLTGKQELMLGALPSEQGSADMRGPGFNPGAVIEAQAIEILPDGYRLAEGGDSRCFRVVRLRVINQIYGEGFPKEIFLSYPFYDGDTVFEGYERFILSINQVGIENYAMINETERRIDYFPNMFWVSMLDPYYGSVIAFNDGKVDDRFWENAALDEWVRRGLDSMLDFGQSVHSYPASRRSTVAQVKRATLDLVHSEQIWKLTPSEYVTAEDLFLSQEAKEIRAYVKPDETNVFSCDLYVNEEWIVAYYTRLINGIATDEVIKIEVCGGDRCEVTRSGEGYTPEDLSAVPDIGQALEKMDLSALQPPHLEDAEELNFLCATASGAYRKTEGRVYGIVRGLWYYGAPDMENAYKMDDLYYLYDAEGTGRVASREELQALFGDDSFIEDFSYDAYFTVLC